MRRELAAICLLAAVSISFHVYDNFLCSTVSSSSAAAAATADSDDVTPPPPARRWPSAFDRRVVLSHNQDPAGENYDVRNFPLQRHGRPSSRPVLFPDWEVFVVLPPGASPVAPGELSCVFHAGDASPALSAGDRAVRCLVPDALRGRRRLFAPRVVGYGPVDGGDSPRAEMIRWSYLVYESFSTAEDVVVFAKGVNNRQGVNRSPADLRCLFLSYDSGGSEVTVASTAVTSSAQEVFRCRHPTAETAHGSSRSIDGTMHVTLAVGKNPAEATSIPTVAHYIPPPAVAPQAGPEASGRSLLCACTMVRNVAKFLREWIVYNAAVGVEHFFLYDNGSEDELASAVSRLVSEGYNVSTRFWPWPKTQEAGFGHCAVANRAACEWMAFLDVDEYMFSPSWSEFDSADRSMFGSLVAVEPEVGQVSVRCFDFGPSGRRVHPSDGVTQGYTCRRRGEERHKSIVRLNAVADSLLNVIHHFELRDRFETRVLDPSDARVNHYKYQAWEEFKSKFHRRVSAYVVDWTKPVNMKSQDRTPGLGWEAVEPDGWHRMFCEVKDALLRKTTRKWFEVMDSNGTHKMAWQ